MSINEEEMQTYTIILAFLIVVPLIQLKHFKDKHYNIKIWVGNMLKVNSLNYLLFGNYVLCFSILPVLADKMRDYFGTYIGNNLCSIINFMFFTLFALFFPKLTCIYYNFTKSLQMMDRKTIVLMIRFCLVFVISVPVSSVINMDKNDWGSWLMLFSYINFLFSFYTRKNVFLYILKNLMFLFFSRKSFLTKAKIAENDAECLEIISGCLLDLIIIVNSRLIILTWGRRWLHECVYEIYYLNCQFEISENFKFSFLGVYSIIAVNIAVTVGIIGYMIKKQKQLFEYRMTDHYIANIYYLLMFHNLFEGTLQILYFIMKN